VQNKNGSIAYTFAWSLFFLFFSFFFSKCKALDHLLVISIAMAIIWLHHLA
jgi:hypothetical protein